MNLKKKLLFALVGLQAAVISEASAQAVAGKAAQTGFFSAMPPLVLITGSILIFMLAILTLFLVMTFFSALPILEKFYNRPENRELPLAGMVILLRGDTTSLVGKNSDVLIEDHDYDGIHEFDNDLPPWWKYSFYVTIVFGIFYLFHYHVWSSGKLQDEEYRVEMEQAALIAASSEEISDPNAKTDYKVLSDKAALENGKTTFMQNCAACHGQQAEGAVGPNLTDEFWLHGGDINDVFRTVKFGVTSKGMVAWNKKLSNKQILEVASYIQSIQGTNPPNAKAPQGEKAK